MGSFAVVRHPDEPSFTVEACHLNLWCLAGFFGRRVFYWDVGISLEVAVNEQKKGLKKLELLLPFTTEPDAFQDLSTEILDQNTARLVFGKSVVLDREKKSVTYPSSADRPPLVIEPIDTATIDKGFHDDKRVRRANLSLWTIEFASHLTHGTKYYVRMRFRMQDQGRTWLWLRSKRTALVDVRVGDIREIVIPSEAGSKLEAVAQRFVPLSRLNLFVIVPGHLLFKATSPATHYVRLFEGRVWQPYLGGRAVSLGKPEKMMIYQWRFPDESKSIHPHRPASVQHVPQAGKPNAGRGDHSSNEPTISARDPFRAFLVVGEEKTPREILSALLAAAIALGGLELILHPAAIEDSYQWALRAAATYGLELTVGGILLGLLRYAFKHWGTNHDVLARVLRLFRNLEDWAYHTRGKW